MSLCSGSGSTSHASSTERAIDGRLLDAQKVGGGGEALLAGLSITLMCECTGLMLPELSSATHVPAAALTPAW